MGVIGEFRFARTIFRGGATQHFPRHGKQSIRPSRIFRKEEPVGVFGTDRRETRKVAHSAHGRIKMQRRCQRKRSALTQRSHNNEHVSGGVRLTANVRGNRGNGRRILLRSPTGRKSPYEFSVIRNNQYLAGIHRFSSCAAFPLWSRSASSTRASSRLTLMPRFTALSVFIARLSWSMRSWKCGISFRACATAWCNILKSRTRLIRSMAADSMARETMTRRRSSESCPEALMNAATSQADNKTRVSCTVTVVIERPRTGGVAINCSQIFSSKVSTSAAAKLGIFCSGDETASLDEAGGVVFAGCFPAGATSSDGFADGADPAGIAGLVEGMKLAGGLPFSSELVFLPSTLPPAVAASRVDACPVLPCGTVPPPRASSKSSRRHMSCSYARNDESCL